MKTWSDVRLFLSTLAICGTLVAISAPITLHYIEARESPREMPLGVLLIERADGESEDFVIDDGVDGIRPTNLDPLTLVLWDESGKPGKKLRQVNLHHGDRFEIRIRAARK